jgi:protein SCO1/2
MKRLLPIVLIVLLAAALVWLSMFWQFEPKESIQVAAAPQGGDFVLNSASGPVSLESMRGRVVVLYFGYTMCPDVCPTSLSLLAAALNGLSKDELEQVRPIFISVDPDRDGLERLQVYATFFHPSIQGITGTNEQLAEIAKKYGVAYRKNKQEDSAMGYVVDHTADLYIVDRQGKLRETVKHGTPPSGILQSLRRVLDAGPNNKQD